MNFCKWTIFIAIAAALGGCKPMDLLVSVDNFDKASYQETYLGMMHMQKVVGDKVEVYTDPVPVSMSGNGDTVDISGLTGIGSIRLTCGSYYEADSDNPGQNKLVDFGRVSGLVAEVTSETEMKISNFLGRDEDAEKHKLTVSGTMILKENKTVLETVAPEHITITAEILDDAGKPSRREVVRIRFSGELTTPM